MITILISGPQKCGKSKIAHMLIKALRQAGFVRFNVYTTNIEIIKEQLEQATHEYHN